MKVSTAIWTGCLSSGMSGFFVGTLLSTASWSQVWPFDALIVALIFALPGGIIGWFGHYIRRRMHYIFFNAVFTPVIALVLSIYYLEKFVPLGRFTLDGQAVALLGMSWLVSSLVLGYAAFLPGLFRFIE